MRILIIGGGSIGQKHLRNLISLGTKNVFVVDLNSKKTKEMREKYQVGVYNNLQLALKEKWDIFFICTPPTSHIEIALKLIKKKKPIFIEKPLSNSLKNIPILIKKIKQNKISVMIGYNLRFHPQIQEIRKIIKKNILGKILEIRAEFGQYLPDWHPWEDYRYGYSARKKLGGGIVLDDIHGIDYLCYFFGGVKKILAFVDKISNLQIDTEDCAEITLWFKNGIIGQVHTDYLQRVPSRNLKIIGEKGTLLWDIKSAELKYFLSKDKKWRIHQLKNFDYNKLYIDEIKYFLNCVKNKKNPESDIINGRETLKIALAAKKSAKLNKIINL